MLFVAEFSSGRISVNGHISKQGQNLKKSALPRVTNDISYISFLDLHKT